MFVNGKVHGHGVDAGLRQISRPFVAEVRALRIKPRAARFGGRPTGEQDDNFIPRRRRAAPGLLQIGNGQRRQAAGHRPQVQQQSRPHIPLQRHIFHRHPIGVKVIRRVHMGADMGCQSQLGVGTGVGLVGMQRLGADAQQPRHRRHPLAAQSKGQVNQLGQNNSPAGSYRPARVSAVWM